MRRRFTMLGLIALLASPAGAAAQDDGLKGQWSFTFSAGAGIPAGGNVHDGGTGTVLGLPTTVESRSYSDVYDPGFRWNADLGYGVSRTIEVFGRFEWKRAESDELSVGNVAGLDLRGKFATYTSYAFDGGIRWIADVGSAAKPYFALVGGVAVVDAIPSTFSVPAAGVVLTDTPFYDDSIVPTVGGDVGVLFSVSPTIGIGAEVGLRYHAALSDVEGLAGTGLENINDVGDRWSVPISGVVRFRF
jgi:hypothetical protein